MQGKFIHLTARRALVLFCVSVLIAANLFVFGPFTIYSGNVDEFTVSLSSILGFLSFPALALVTLLFAVGLFLPDGAFRRYVAVLFAIGLLIWIQGNILVWKYGLLDGQGIDWSRGTWRGWVDGAVCVILLGTAVLLSGRIYRVAFFSSIVLVSLQLVLLVTASLKSPEIWDSKPEISKPPPKEVFEYSARQNVIQLILDGFQSDIFAEIIKENPAYYDAALEGFTFFPEATGSFPTTKMSIPAIMSGRAYQNDVPMSEFITHSFDGNTISNALLKNGYEVDILNLALAGIDVSEKSTYSYSIPIPYGLTGLQHGLSTSAFVFDLVLFRQAPHIVKKHIYNNQLWLTQPLFSIKEQDNLRYFAHDGFLIDLINKSSIGRAAPVYKIIHVMTTHFPVVVNGQCEYAGGVLKKSRASIYPQCKCSLARFIELLDKLKSLGIYDSSLIILHADHGARLSVAMRGTKDPLADKTISDEDLSYIAGSALPLLAVKMPFSRGPLTISEAQVSLTDLPDTICSALGLSKNFGGRSVFAVAPEELRERKFYYYKWLHENWQDEFFSHLDEFTIHGSVYDTASWRLRTTHHMAGLSYQTDRINFGTREAFQYLRAGWSHNEQSSINGHTFNWAAGSSASLFLSLPKNEVTVLSANLKSLPFEAPQHVSVRVDGKEMGRWELMPPWALTNRDVIIPPDRGRPDISVIEFIFSEHRISEGDARPLAVMFESLALKDFEPFRWGEQIAFSKAGDGITYEAGGWSTPEEKHTWTSGKVATLVIPILPPKSKFITLRAELHPFIVPGKVDRQTVRVLVNGRKAGTWNITKPGLQEQTLRIPASLLTDPYSLNLTFDLPDAVSPVEVGYNMDRRVLALAFRSLKLSDK